MNKIINDINKYYSTKIEQHGATPKGVDWNSFESQKLRFDVLSKLIEEKETFSVLDFGCGFGAMYEYFTTKYNSFEYIGYDVSQKMINAALDKFSDKNDTKWTTTLPINPSDYVIASGIFNVKLDNSNKEWLDYIIQTLNLLDSLAIKGFSFNILTKYSDQEHMKENLYYADPLFLFDYCKTNFSKNIALLHDYNLYEFTISIKKNV